MHLFLKSRFYCCKWSSRHMSPNSSLQYHKHEALAPSGCVTICLSPWEIRNMLAQTPTLHSHNISGYSWRNILTQVFMPINVTHYNPPWFVVFFLTHYCSIYLQLLINIDLGTVTAFFRSFDYLFFLGDQYIRKLESQAQWKLNFRTQITNNNTTKTTK